MDFATGLGQLVGGELDVLGLPDGEVIVGFDFDLAVSDDGQVFLGLELGEACGFHRVVAFVADADLLVVLAMFVPVALSVEMDLLGTLAVFDAKFVVASTAGAGERFEDGSGLVGRQAIRHLVFGIVETAGYQGMIGIAF